MRPTTPPDDPTELLLYNQYSLAAGSALFELLGEGFMLCVCVGMWGFWNMMHVKREPWGIQLLAHYQLLASLASTGYWFHLFLNLFVYSPNEVHTLLQGDLVRSLYIVELYTAIPIEIFYIYRCWQLWDRRLWLLASLLPGIGGVIGGGSYLLSQSDLNYFEILSGAGFWAFVGMLATMEWTISVTLYLGLRRLRDQTMFQSTRRLVERIIVWSAEIQLLPSCLEIGVLIKTAVKPRIAISALYCFFPKFWTVTFFVILTAKQILRDQALQQQAENQMNLNIMGELTEPEEHGAFRSSINGLTCSLPFIGGSKSSKRGQDPELEAGLSGSQTVSLPALPVRGDTIALVPDGLAEEIKDLVVSDFSVHITGAPTTTDLSSTIKDNN